MSQGFSLRQVCSKTLRTVICVSNFSYIKCLKSKTICIDFLQRFVYLHVLISIATNYNQDHRRRTSARFPMLVITTTTNIQDCSHCSICWHLVSDLPRRFLFHKLSIVKKRYLQCQAFKMRSSSDKH